MRDNNLMEADFKELEHQFEKSLLLNSKVLAIKILGRYLNTIYIRSKAKKLVLQLGRHVKPTYRNVSKYFNKVDRKLFSKHGDLAFETSQREVDGCFEEKYIHLGKVYNGIEELIADVQVIKCDVVVCCSFLERHEVLSVVLKEVLTGPSSVGLCLVGTTEADLHFLEKISFENPRVLGVIKENLPLGAKWQAAIDFAFGFFNADLFMITGSDDIVPMSTILDVHAHYTKSSSKPAMYGCRSWFIYYWLGGGYEPSCIKCRYAEEFNDKTLGAGRFYSREFLVESGSRLFDLTKSRRLDEYGDVKSLESGRDIIVYDDIFNLPLSIKGRWEQLNDVAEIANAKTLVSIAVGGQEYEELYNSLPHIFNFFQNSQQQETSLLNKGLLYPLETTL